MSAFIGLPVAVFGGLDNGQFEHAAVVTYVHRNFKQSLDGQIGMVNVRVFLDGALSDRVLKLIPLLDSRSRAVNLHSFGVSHAAFLLDNEEDMLVQPTRPDDPLPPMPALVAMPPYMTDVAVH